MVGRSAVALLLVSACAPIEVELEALTYNIAGLPQGISRSDPERNTALISPLLEPFDLVMVQEDFTYHDALVSRSSHPFRSTPKEPTEKLAGDGLSVLSRFRFGDLTREPWAACNGGLDNGSDCLAEKGFAVATHILAEGLAIDVYNLHLDAGGDEADIATRSQQVDQLLAALQSRSAGAAVIVAGDTNLRLRRPGDVISLDRLKAGAALADACELLACPELDHIDRFLFRGGPQVELQVLAWERDLGFVDPEGQDLSDHPAIRVRFHATAR